MNLFIDYYNVVLANPALKGLALVAVSIAVAKVVDVIFTLIFKRLVDRTKTSLDDRILQLLHKPIFYSILFIGFTIAIKTAILPDYIDFALIGIFKTITIFIWILVISKIFIMSMEWTTRQKASNLLQKNTLPLFNNLGKIAIGLFGIYFIFLSWDININGILASAGVLGVVLGLAAKDTVSNFFAGIFLMADSPFKEGDYILLETGERGYVKQMGLRSTRFMTRDDIEITLPNSLIANSKIINESGGPKENERVRINISVAYGSDIDQVKQVLLDIAIHHDGVCVDPEPRVRFRVFGASGLALELLCWIDEPVLRGMITDALNTEVYRRFNEEKIEIPYAKQDLYLKEMPEGG